jgi:hypothetical protein
LSGNLGITLIKQPSQVSFVRVRMASVGRHDQSHTLFGGPVESTMSKSKQDCCYPAFKGRHVRTGARQSIPSSNIASSAEMIATLPLNGDGQTNPSLADEAIIGLRIRICRYGSENDGCSVSSQPVRRNDFSQHMPRSTIPSTPTVI